MKIKYSILALGLLAVAGSSCSDSKSYAELLSDERKATNQYLAQYRVINEIPADTVFEVGENAPYYRIDEEGNVYMQVLKADSKENRPVDDQRVYFRYMRLDLLSWKDYGTTTAEGNAENMIANPAYFLFNNYTLSTSSQYGYGIQMPLKYIGVESKVNLIIKSQYGWSDEISNVIPYKYTVTYYKSQI